MQTARFDYDQAFVRNLGWVTEAEQLVLRGKRVAIAGLGGVGGVHLLTLARLGIGRFSVADMDLFDVANFNRQVGATVSTIGRSKLDVLTEMARDINPEVDVRGFPRGVTPENVDAFLQDADCYVDGLDFFAFAAREAVFAACARRRIPAVTAAPIGMGTALLCFLPDGMTFEQYFRLSGVDETEKAARLLAGLVPRMLHRGYLVDPSRVSLSEQRGPSTAMACQLCAGVAGTEVLKILLRRGRLRGAPWAMQFDAYSGALRWSWRPGGNANPLQRILVGLVRRQLGGMPASSRADGLPDRVAAVTRSLDASPALEGNPLMKRLIEAAVLAPSADNRHHGHFEVGRSRVRACLAPAELADMPRHRRLMTLFTFGAMAENMCAQAAGLGVTADVRRSPDSARPEVVFEVSTSAGADRGDDLSSAIVGRATNRHFYRRSAASSTALAQLQGEVEKVPGVSLVWLDDPPLRKQALRLIRIAETERFARKTLHQEMFGAIRFDAGWDKATDRGLPPGALEVERPLRGVFGLMRHWPLMRALNLFGTHRLLGLRAGDLPCRLSPHLALIATDAVPEDGAFDCGRAFQRLWLRATLAGLSLQPLAAAAYFPLQLSDADGASAKTRARLRTGWTSLVPHRTPLMVFRLGYAKPPSQKTGREPPHVEVVAE